MSFPRFSLSSFVTLFSFQGTIFYIDFKFKQVCVQFAFSSTSSRTSVHKTEKKCEMCVKLFELVEMRRIELLTPCLQGRCSPSWATPPNFSWYFVIDLISRLWLIFRISRMSNLRLASYSPMCLLVTATSLPIAPLRFTISHRHAHTMFRIATQC